MLKKNEIKLLKNFLFQVCLERRIACILSKSFYILRFNIKFSNRN